MPQEGLQEKVKAIRKNKYVTKPAVKKRSKKAQKKKANKVEALLAGMSPEDRIKLLKSLDK